MEIREINTVDYIGKSWSLLEAHREELATHKHLMALAPDIARYNQLESHGRLFTLGVFDDAGEIVGYSVNILTTLLHYSATHVMQNDLLYLREDLRGTRWGVKLIKDTRNLAKQKGAHLMQWHAKEGTTFEKMLRKRKCRVQDVIFSEEL